MGQTASTLPLLSQNPPIQFFRRPSEADRQREWITCANGLARTERKIAAAKTPPFDVSSNASLAVTPDRLSGRRESASGQVRRCWPPPPTVRFTFHSGHGAALPRTGGLGQEPPYGGLPDVPAAP